MYGGEEKRCVWGGGGKECMVGRRKGVYGGEEERSVWWGGEKECMIANDTKIHKYLAILTFIGVVI